MNCETIKRTMLVVVMALMVLAGGPCLADGEEGDAAFDAKNPLPWMTLSADARLRWTYADNNGLNGNILDDSARHEVIFNRNRFRFGVNMTPVDNIEVNARLVWENWSWYKQNVPRNYFEERDALLDRMNVVWKNPFDLSMDVTIGRQDIILGGGWLVLEGTPLDGSRTIFFDAVRFDVDLDDATKATLVYIDQKAASDDYFNTIGHEGPARNLIENDEQGAIVWIDNTSLIEGVATSGYFLYKREEARNTGAGNDIYVVGSELKGELAPDVTYVVDGAYQFGNKGGTSLVAWGANAVATWDVKDEMNSKVKFGYEYLSGDDNGVNGSFDSMWGRWARWSDMYCYRVIPETGKIGWITNMHRFSIQHVCNPIDKLTLDTAYNLLLNDASVATGTNVGSNGNSDRIRGHHVRSRATYAFTDNISGHIQGEIFFPDSFHTSAANDIATFLRTELTAKW